MSESSSSEDPLPLDLAREVERLCDRFEAAWRSGSPPRLEDHLAQGPETLPPTLLRELILLDIHSRQARGESCQPADSQQRFPELDPEWLDAAFTRAHTEGPKTASAVGAEAKLPDDRGDAA